MIRLKSILNEILNEERLRGEWWIDQNGQAHFADANTGDMNHEGYVIQELTRQILDHLGIDARDDNGALGEYIQEIGESLKDNGDIETDVQLQQYQSEPALFILKILQRDKFTSDDKQTEDALKIAYGHTSIDARSYSMKWWRWKAVRGNVIQTWELTRQDIQIIVSGLEDAYSEELDELDPEEITDDNPEGHRTFELEVFSTRSQYRYVPFNILMKRDPTALNPYRSRY